jgi:hypothetical protein
MDEQRQEIVLLRVEVLRAVHDLADRIAKLEASQAATAVKLGLWGVFGAILGAVGVILLKAS